MSVMDGKYGVHDTFVLCFQSTAINTYRATAVDRLTDLLQRAEVLGIILGLFIPIDHLVRQFTPQLKKSKVKTVQFV